MGMDALLGNEQLKENLRNSLRAGRVSHFYLISGPTGSGKHTLAKLLSAAILCGSADKPCLSCPVCRKVMADTHPDCITVEDPEHKNVAVRLVRDARADMYVMPNEGSRKIYIFPQELGVEGQNALLKILEEPPQYGVFILLSDNPEKLLPTVRSRCTHLRLSSLPDETLRQALKREFPDATEESLSAVLFRSGGYLGQAKALLAGGNSVSEQTENFIRAFTERDTMALLKALVPMEKWKRDQAIEQWLIWLELLQNALTCHGGMPALSPLVRQLSISRSSQELMGAINTLKTVIEYAQGNVSVAAICGYLQWTLR